MPIVTSAKSGYEYPDKNDEKACSDSYGVFDGNGNGVNNPRTYVGLLERSGSAIAPPGRLRSGGGRKPEAGQNILSGQPLSYDNGD